MRKKKNIVLEKVLVENYAAEGKSLARQEGKVIFIENVVPGDVVDVRLLKNKKDWAEGYAVQFQSYSKERVIPFCQHFGVCGGCQWQMLPYHKQLQYKQQQVIDNVTRIGKIKLGQTLPIAGAAQDKFYRNKLEYTFSIKEFTPNKPPAHPNLSGGKATNTQPWLIQNVKGKTNTLTSEVGDLPLPGSRVEGNCKVSEQVIPPFDPGSHREKGAGALGFHAKGFFDKVVQIERCWLQPEPNNEIRNALYDFAQQKKFSFYNHREHRGFLRNLQLRICTTGEVMVNIVFGEEDEPKRSEVLQFIKQKFPQITTLVYTINPKWNDSLNDLEPITYFGKGYVIEKLEEFQFKIGPKSFFQTNTQQAEKLYQITREFAELNGSQTLYDLYCGTGSIGIFCSKGAKKIIGVEAIEEAISDAKENALLNNIHHAEFFTGDVIDVCNNDFFLHHGKPDVIITDPPRAGMHEKLIRKILEIEAPVVVYVSCNPATQARDLALLSEKYEVNKLQPVDMFPHTHHIENVIQLKRK